MKEKKTMQVRDMTKGNPLGLILGFAVPLFIGNFFQQVYSMVDTMVAGYNIGKQAIAAIGASNTINALLFTFASSINSGFAIVVSRMFGAQRKEELRQSVAMMILANGIFAVLISALGPLLMRSVMQLLNTPEVIFEQAYLYIAVICTGMFATMFYNMLASILRAVGNSRIPLIFLIISCVLNIILDVGIIIGFDTGVEGAALATVIAQMISVVLCCIYMVKNYQEIMPKREDFRIPKVLAKEVWLSGWAMAVMMFAVTVGSVILQSSMNRLGEKIIAAYTASRKIIDMLMQPLLTIGTATATFVGQNWGANKMQRIRETLRKVMGIQMAWSLGALVLILLAGEKIVVFTTGIEDSFVLENAMMTMRINFVFFLPLGILLCLRMAMQSMGMKVVPIVTSSIELIMKILSAGVMIDRLGYLGACLTEPVSWLICMVFLLGIYVKSYGKLYENK